MRADHRIRLFALVFFLAVSCISSRGAELSDADRKLANNVFQQLLAVTPAPQGMAWPPTLELVEKSEINAAAFMRKDAEGHAHPVVICYSELLQKVVEGNADRLAFILGHELSHHLLGHTTASSGSTDFLQATFTREQEIAADRRGMELALRANYSYTGALSATRKMIELGLNYSSFEALSADHPSAMDRIALLDKQQASLWRSMSAFDNGVYFLLIQNYFMAERAFRQVTKEFPGSYEAWANLGYALLMQYADALNTEDLQHFDVGQIVVGGFYRRPQSLESKVRGVNEELWWDAVGALREAIRLKPDLSLPKANLGIAYLLRPAGKDPGKAAQLLEEASQLAAGDSSLDPISRLAEDINLAVAYASQGDNEKAMAALGRVETSLKQGTAPPSGARSVSTAISYNRALLLARSPDAQRQRMAIAELENYLRQAPPSLAWWPLAYQRYTALCKEFSVVPQSVAVLSADKTVRFRPVLGVNVAKAEIDLAQSLTQVKQQLGAAAATIPVVRGTNLIQLNYPERGLRLLGTEDLLAIVLYGDASPALSVRPMGMGAKAMELKVGMTSDDLDRLMGDTDYDFRQLIDPDLNYRFYSDLGIAVLVKGGKVTELVVSQIPKQLALIR